MILNMVGGGGVSGFPEYTYTGYSTLIDDGDGNWRIKFLTSGTLIFTKLKSTIDVFLVGGGGGGQNGITSGGNYFVAGGGGGGYTDLFGPIAPGINTAISVLVGAGGVTNSAAQAGTSSFGSFSVVGGYGVNSLNGGNGGSGGGGGGGGAGGTDGGNGAPGQRVAGIGQGTTTREFKESGGYLYSNGGNGGGGSFVPQAKAANTGDGGDGGGTATAGASGVVVIRNQRI